MQWPTCVICLSLVLLPLSSSQGTEADFREGEGPVPAPYVLPKAQWSGSEHQGSTGHRALRAPLSEACKGRPYDTYYRAARTERLQLLLDRATPGTMIELLPGTFDRTPGFKLSINMRLGLPDKPIVVCGPQDAVITSAGNKDRKPYVFLVRNSSYVQLVGFTLTGPALKGLVIEQSDNVLAQGLYVSNTDQEAVRVRYASTNTVIRGCNLTNTGRNYTLRGQGEGVYVGSAYHFGDDFTANTRIIGNRIGPGVTAEMVDIKENTRGGVIRGNIFNGRDLSGDNYADSWVDVKGTGWLVVNNRGRNTLKDGFQTHSLPSAYTDSGKNNIFRDNYCNLGTASGACVAIYCDGGKDQCNNVVKCSNKVMSVGGAGKLTNLNSCVQ